MPRDASNIHTSNSRTINNNDGGIDAFFVFIQFLGFKGLYTTI